MSSILIPDSGPLFSLAAGDLLDLLLNFRVSITDIVKKETIDRGRISGCSTEAGRIYQFHSANPGFFDIRQTQVGHILNPKRGRSPQAPLPKNAGELSIQSLLIELILSNQPALVLFEDSWFLRNSSSIPANCRLISTEAFLINAQKMKLIPSAEEARLAISQLRPTAYRIPKNISRGRER